MPHYQFPAHFVFWTKVENHEQIKSKYLSKIRSLNKSTHQFACNVTSNINDHTKFLDDDVYTDLVWKPIDEMIKESGGELLLGDSFIQSYWYNIYKPGDFQEKHEHSAYPIKIDGKLYHPSLSMIYILNDENTEGSTLFVDKVPVPFGPCLKYAAFDTSKIEEIGEGTVIIFSSRLEHLVKPVKIGGRVTIAFNIFSSFS